MWRGAGTRQFVLIPGDFVIGRREFRDAKIEQLHDAVVGDENISWLEVAVHNQFRVRELHRGAYLTKEIESLADRERVGVAPRVDALTADVLHDEVRKAVVGRTAIVQCGDVGVREFRENLSLSTEAPRKLGAIETERERLDSDALVERRIDVPSFIDDPHATATDLALDPVRAECLPDQSRGSVLRHRDRAIRQRREKIIVDVGVE